MNASSRSRWATSRRASPRSRAIACLVLLAGTTLNGLLAHGQVPHGALERVGASSAGGPGLEIIHLVFAAGLTAAILWHLIDKRRSLVAFAKRRKGQSLRCLLVDVAIAGLLVAALVTGLAVDGPGQIPHHVAVSAVLAAAGTWHGGRRVARRRLTPRGVPAGVKP